jgi:hypothetical protein
MEGTQEKSKDFASFPKPLRKLCRFSNVSLSGWRHGSVSMKNTIYAVILSMVMSPTLSALNAHAESEKDERKRERLEEKIADKEAELGTVKRDATAAARDLAKANTDVAAAQARLEKFDSENPDGGEWGKGTPSDDAARRKLEDDLARKEARRDELQGRLDSLKDQEIALKDEIEKYEKQLDRIGERDDEDDCVDGNCKGKKEAPNSGKSGWEVFADVLKAATPLGLGAMGLYGGIQGMKYASNDYRFYGNSMMSLGLPFSPPSNNYGGILGAAMGPAMVASMFMNGWGMGGGMYGGPMMGGMYGGGFPYMGGAGMMGGFGFMGGGGFAMGGMGGGMFAPMGMGMSPMGFVAGGGFAIGGGIAMGMGGGFAPYGMGMGGGFAPYGMGMAPMGMGYGMAPYGMGMSPMGFVAGGGFAIGGGIAMGMGGGFAPYGMGGGFAPYGMGMGGGFAPYGMGMSPMGMGGGFAPYGMGMSPMVFVAGGGFAIGGGIAVGGGFAPYGMGMAPMGMGGGFAPYGAPFGGGSFGAPMGMGGVGYGMPFPIGGPIGYPGGYPGGFPGIQYPYANPYYSGNPNCYGGLCNYNPYFSNMNNQYNAGGMNAFYQNQQQQLQAQIRMLQQQAILSQDAAVAGQALNDAQARYQQVLGQMQGSYYTGGMPYYGGAGYTTPVLFPGSTGQQPMTLQQPPLNQKRL